MSAGYTGPLFQKNVIISIVEVFIRIGTLLLAPDESWLHAKQANSTIDKSHAEHLIIGTIVLPNYT